MNQGDVYWYTFRHPDKRRPVLILTRTSAIPYLTGITVAPITSMIRGNRSEVALTPEEDGVLVESAITFDNIQTVQKSNLDSYLTSLSAERMREVRIAIEFAFDFAAMG
jgi:mRNA interferase MazF